MFRPHLVPAVVALGALLAGCGQGYGKPNFVSRADAICAATLRDARAIGPPAPGSAAGLAGYTARILRLVRRQDAQLRTLPLPPGTSSQTALLRRYLAANEKAVRDYSALAAAAQERDAAGIAGAEAALRASPVSALAARYGLRDCAAPGATVR